MHKTKKGKQNADKPVTAQNMGRVQKDNSEEVWEYVLYLLNNGVKWKQLAHGTYVGEGQFGSILEIRFTSVTSPVFRLQYTSRRNGSGLLQKNVSGNRARRNAKAGKGQTSNSERHVTLPKGFGGI